ncbi:MAG TPA: sigma 54-interacting transcriptional regulator [Vicinamibacterales bacterium]|jgi:formate hydrogenlyase transcriptional activator|nr:sigma 54-interacting transcriptional regulator [Vicinamibacterales bacterium]
MTPGPAAAPDAAVTARYEALVRVSEALGACHDRDTLFRALTRELRRVVSFDFLGVAIYDEAAHTIDPYVLESTGEAIQPPHLTAEESLTYWVVRHQEPAVIPVIDQETRFPQATGYMSRQGMRSACGLPLTTVQRRVGMLLAGSRQPHAYDSEDITFLSLVANQVALAVDDALNYGALQDALVAERERTRNLEASDELLRALLPVLNIREIFPRISEIAATVIPHDHLTLTFHADDGEATVEASSDDRVLLVKRLKLNPVQLEDDTYTIVDDLAATGCPVAEPPDCWERVRQAGFQSMLILRQRVDGQQLSLQFWSKRPWAFSQAQVSVARRILDHVSLAVSHERLAETAREAAEARLKAARLEARVRSLSDELASKGGHGRVVGASPQWQGVLKAATQVAQTDTTVLLEGESGTGKEVVARFVHRASSRDGGPFVALNCAALPEQLLESELFGHERGAFTGAQAAKPGQIELAAGGVLFLDEVSEMSASAQAKFLRVLQEREFQRLGGTRSLKANVRVVAATNRDLKKAMERGDFRADLYYRLKVFDIHLPALRERTDDILPLSEAFLEDIGRLFGRPPAGLTRDAKDALLAYHWPGNVRELRNALERAAILCDGGLITADHLSLSRERSVAAAGAPAPATTNVNDIERDLIRRVLGESGGNKSRAAARLGLSRTQLYVRLRKYQLA